VLPAVVAALAYRMRNRIVYIPVFPVVVQGCVSRMVSARAIEGTIIGLFVILNGLYTVLAAPGGDEPQGYALIAIGASILLITVYFPQENKDPDRNTGPESR
jgi:hypothetical protein